MNQDTARISERLSSVLRGAAEKIIPPKRPSRPGKAQIAVEEADDRYRKLRIENTLTDGHGDDVKLKKGRPR
jgi:hypothetical protein